MKSLSEVVNESLDQQNEMVNEGLFTTVGGVLASILGWKLIAVFAAGLGVYGLIKSKDKRVLRYKEQMEKEWLPRMESMLNAHPKSRDYILNYAKTILDAEDDLSLERTLKLKSHGYVGVRETLFLKDMWNKVDDSWTEEEKQEFENLWQNAIKITNEARDAMFRANS